MAETGERALLAIISEHLEVTSKLLEGFIAIRQSPALANFLPASFPKIAELQELRSSTAELLERVQSTLDLK